MKALFFRIGGGRVTTQRKAIIQIAERMSDGKQRHHCRRHYGLEKRLTNIQIGCFCYVHAIQSDDEQTQERMQEVIRQSREICYPILSDPPWSVHLEYKVSYLGICTCHYRRVTENLNR